MSSNKQSINVLLVVSFGILTMIAVVTIISLVVVTGTVSSTVQSMQHEEHSIRLGGKFSNQVRDFALALALEEDPIQLRKDLSHTLVHLSSVVPDSHRSELASIQNNFSEVDRQLTTGIIPEVFLSLKKLSTRADELAVVIEAQMADSHVEATKGTNQAMIIGAIGGISLFLLALIFTFRLRNAVTKPLHELGLAAGQFAKGNFDYRLGNVEGEEMGALARSMDQMARELTLREKTLLRNERMAAIGQLAAGVAHELNNPITVIRGYVSTVKSDSPEVNEALNIIDEEALQCQNIVADLLSYARSGDLDVQQVEMASFLGKIAERFSAIDERGVKYTSESAEVICDPGRLRQVVNNLLSNASASGTEVVMQGKSSGGHYVLEVHDNGPGVEEENYTRIFEPFYSLRKGGSGLGLSVSLSLIRAHRGTIEVGPSHLGGACFSVKLPLGAINES